MFSFSPLSFILHTFPCACSFVAKLLNAYHILGKFTDKGIEDNTQFLKGGQWNNPLNSDKGQVGKHDGSACEQMMET
jgi:hypothetical protein